MAQSWTDLLFAHWRVPPEALKQVVPAGLPLDTFAGSAWIGVTPFQVRNLRMRFTWPLPILSAFPEINVRTYVTVQGRPGIYFFSLDADSALAVATARRVYRLPYFRARTGIRASQPWVAYTSERRTRGDEPPASFRARYRAIDRAAQAFPGSLEHWLTERYCLYTLDASRRVLRGEIHHAPWQLQPAEAQIDENTMTTGLSIQLAETPLLHYAQRQDVVFWTLEHA